MYLILFVLHNPDMTEDLLTAWEASGVRGVTIFPSTGLGRMRQRGPLWDDLPLIPSLRDLFRHQTEEFSRTFFSVVEDEALVDRVLAATEGVVGDLEQPDTGVLMVIPLVRAYGLSKRPDGA